MAIALSIQVKLTLSHLFKGNDMSAGSTAVSGKIEDLYVQYGCGMSAPEGWLNFDTSPNLLLERLPVIGFFYAGQKYIGDSPVRMKFPQTIQFGDIVKGLPLEKGSVKGIYASHVLEHLPLEDCRVALQNTFNLLEPGGIFRLLVPDLKILASRYINSSEPGASVSFIQAMEMGTIRKSRGVKGLVASFLSKKNHVWMWDYNSMKLELEKIGFTNIRRANFNDSEDPMFKNVEDERRFIEAVAIQCQKPA
ncbi:methyltransferase domain-containing protein [Oscillatoria laete-virens NRMC-F 0139]|nr:methyltransferase domain-containing protein [Oscillatoria laete-virens]MDL5052271.1 methyltransferase domain-containing protein [Oscillatoria laete-virens NRMC-F 0139]